MVIEVINTQEIYPVNLCNYHAAKCGLSYFALWAGIIKFGNNYFQDSNIYVTRNNADDPKLIYQLNKW